MNIEIKHHTIILLVGPSGCGKTYFAQNTLIPQLKEKTNCNIQYISSDYIRKELLGVDENYDKYALNMLSSSKEAFDLLYKKVSCVTKFPINAEFVIVDTKGVNEFFRNRIIQIAKNHHYGVNVIMFNYDNYSDYFDDKSLSGAINKSIRKDIAKIKSSIRQSLRHQKIQEISTIKKKDFSNIIIDVHNIQLYEKCFVDNDRELLIISDVHGCYDEFVKLLNKNDIVVKNHKIISNKFNKLIILAGDYVDKGPKILDMIYFCHENINDIKIIIGNLLYFSFWLWGFNFYDSFTFYRFYWCFFIIMFRHTGVVRSRVERGKYTVFGVFT
jgi:predicted kinase